uniref:KH domain-containing protein n=1 Tax=Macrostomum lignano TaxID=282301 RepID=A0A1I8GY25_9PLAT
MSNPTFEAALAKAKQIAASLSASAPDGGGAAASADPTAGAKRSFNSSNSDDDDSPATKRSFAGPGGDSAAATAGAASAVTPASSAKLAAAAAAAAKINEKLCGSAAGGGAAAAAVKPPMLMTSLADAAPAAPSHTVEHKILDRYVGLMIGRGGETITRLQAESGARIQISSDSVDGTRNVTISGGQAEVERAKRMMDAMIAEKGGGGAGDRSRGDQAQESIEINIPASKVGLLIGRAGENIKSLQEKSGVKMILIQDGTTASMSEKPLKITGESEKCYACMQPYRYLLSEQSDAKVEQEHRYPQTQEKLWQVTGHDINKGQAVVLLARDFHLHARVEGVHSKYSDIKCGQQENKRQRVERQRNQSGQLVLRIVADAAKEAISTRAGVAAEVDLLDQQARVGRVLPLPDQVSGRIGERCRQVEAVPGRRVLQRCQAVGRQLFAQQPSARVRMAARQSGEEPSELRLVSRAGQAGAAKVHQEEQGAAGAVPQTEAVDQLDCSAGQLVVPSEQHETELGRGAFGGNHYGGSSGYGESFEEIKVPRRCVGVVIGKGGEMLRKINQDTGAKVQFKQEGPGDRDLPERTLQISGNVHCAQMAVERVHELINAVMNGEMPSADRSRGGGGGGGGPDNRPATYAIPAEKAGLVIGKGGETIKEIQRVSGAYVAIQREPPPNDSIKVFDIQ